jgi:hypothetical protein
MISWVGQFGTITAPLADGADHSTRQNNDRASGRR